MCSSLRSISIPSSLTTLEAYVFASCTSLTSVTIPDGVMSIESYAFAWCDSLESVVIGNGVTSIGNGTFRDCSSLGSITIGSGVTGIAAYAFENCTSLISVCYAGTEAEWSSITIAAGNTSLWTATIYYAEEDDGDTETEHDYYASKTVEATCAEDGYVVYTCATCKDSYTEEIPATGHSYVGGYCSVCGEEQPATEGLEYELNEDGESYSVIGIGTVEDSEIVIPSEYNGLAVTEIADSAFYYCRGLTCIMIPDSVTGMGDSAFYHCTSLTSVSIGNGISSIASSAFWHCSSLVSITIPDNVTRIESYSFGWCSALESVTIGDGVMSIGDSAFVACTNLTSVTIGDGVVTIGECAFDICTSLTSITIPDSVTSLGDEAFWGCDSLESIVIGNGVTSIGSYALCCKNLQAVYYAGTKDEWDNIIISSGNTGLASATIYYYSEPEPEGYWYYDEDGNIAVW